MDTETTDLASYRMGRRVRFADQVIELDDGHRVGVSIGGHGVPLVFLHGLGLSRRHYLRTLNRIAALGFLVVAVDVAGHGDTLDLPCGAGGLSDRTDLVRRTLDALGIRRAVIAGHSMGGRMAIQLAASSPDRVLATVLFDAAAGASFDAALDTVMSSPREMARAAFGAICDMYRDPIWMKIGALHRYLRMLTTVSMGRFLEPTGFIGAAQALMRSGECAALLRALREREIPTMVLHGDCDAIVPFDCARDLAADANATLYRIPKAYHSWLINDPWRGADAVRQLLERELGEVLRRAAATLGIQDWRSAQDWEDALIEPDARLHELTAGAKTLGADTARRVEMQLVRRAKRSAAVERMAATVSDGRVAQTA